MPWWTKLGPFAFCLSCWCHSIDTVIFTLNPTFRALGWKYFWSLWFLCFEQIAHLVASRHGVIANSASNVVWRARNFTSSFKVLRSNLEPRQTLSVGCQVAAIGMQAGKDSRITRGDRLRDQIVTRRRLWKLSSAAGCSHKGFTAAEIASGNFFRSL